MIEEVTKYEELQEILADNGDVVVLFTAPSWCAPCRAFAPHFAVTAEEASSPSVFVKVDIDKADAALSAGIQSVPTVRYYKDGEYKQDLKTRTALAFRAELYDAEDS